MKLIVMALIFTLFTGCNQAGNVRKPDIDKLLTSTDVNNSIIVMDAYLGELCSYGDDMEKLNEYQQNFYYVQLLEAEVNNGGFDQYFYNSGGDHALETIRGLKAIGADKTAKLLQEAMNQFPNGEVPKYREIRISTLEKIRPESEKVFEKLDDAFYTYVDDLNTLNMEYIRNHKNHF